MSSQRYIVEQVSGADNTLVHRAIDQIAALETRLDQLVSDLKLSTPEALRWDDERSPASTFRVSGQVGEPEGDDDGSLLFASTSVEQCSQLYQMTHRWAKTPIGPHIHWAKTTEATGDVIWRYRYRAWNIGEVAPDWSDWILPAGRSHVVGSTKITTIDYFPKVDQSGLKESCMFSIQLQRNTADANDTYGADARMYDFDLHRQELGSGSLNEYGD